SPVRNWAVGIGLVVVAAAVFSPTLRNGFVDLDDEVYVTQNWSVLGGLSEAGAGYAIDSIDHGYWHPVTWLSLELDVTLFGPGPLGFHLTNFVLHALNAGLLYVVCARLAGAPRRSLALALVWALHPLRVEPVA